VRRSGWSPGTPRAWLAAFLDGQFPFGRLGTLPEVAGVVTFLGPRRG
jgi:hypothetical protein